MADNYSVNVAFKGDTSSLENSIKKSQNALATFQDKVAKIGLALGGAFAVVKTVQGLTSAISDLSQASLTQERAEVTLATAVKNNPLMNGEASDRLKEYASYLQSTSTIGDETIIPFMANLVSYGRTEAETMDIMEIAVNMAEAGVMDLGSAVSALNGTLQGNAGLISRQIPALKNLSSEQLKAGEGIKLLKEQYAGTAESISDSVGAIQKMKNSWGDLKETIGKGINTLLNPLAKGFGYIVEGLNKAIQGFEESELHVDEIKNKIDNIRNVSAEGAGTVGYETRTQEQLYEQFKEIEARIRKEQEEAVANIDKKRLELNEIESKISLHSEYRAYDDEFRDLVTKRDELKNLIENYNATIQDMNLERQSLGQSLYEQARASYESAKKQVEKNEKTAYTDINKEYDKLIAKTKTEIENKRKAGIEVSKQEEAQTLLNKGQDFYAQKLNQNYKTNADIEKKIKAQTAELKTQTTVATRTEAIDAYNKSLEAVDKEIQSRKALGEQITEEEELRDKLKVATQGYIDLVSVGLSTESPVVMGAKETVNVLSAQVAEYDRLSETLGTVEKETEDYINANKKSEEIKLSDKIQDTIDKLEEEKATLKEDSKVFELYQKKLEKLAELKEQVLEIEIQETDESKSFTGAIKNKIDAIIESSKDWSDVVDSIAENLSTLATEGMEEIGQALFTGEGDWSDYGATAMNAIAGVLEGLAGQLSAMAVASAMSHQYAEAVAGVAGAASALVVAGTLKAMSNSITQVTDDVEEAVSSLNSFAELLKSLKESISDINSLMNAQKTFFDSIVEIRKNLTDALNDVMDLSLSWIDSMIAKTGFIIYSKELQEAYEAIVETAQELNESYTDSITTSRFMIEEYEDLFNAVDKLKSVTDEYNQTLKTLGEEVANNSESYYQMLKLQEYATLIYNSQLSALESLRVSLYDDLLSTGTSIGETLVNSIIDGTKKEDFLSEMKSYLKENVIKLAVYTESFNEKLANIGSELSTALAGGGDLTTIRTELESLWTEASSNAESAMKIINEAFGNIADNIKKSTNDVEESLTKLGQMIKDFKDEISDLGGEIASNLISGLADGLSQSDFLQTMYDWIRKLIVQTVVYTESMKAEIEAIGQAISNGLADGFSESSLHAIRRDLSYIFYSANKSMEGIDSILDSVFSGYATGTNNATRGLHVVGEEGPELVRFRGGEQVYNAKDTRSILGGSPSNNFNVTFNNTQDTTAYALMRQLKRYDREMAINGVI